MGRKVKLAAPGIGPHIGDRGHHVGIPRQPETLDIEQRRQTLVGDLNIDMLHRNNVAVILRRAIVFDCFGHVLPPACQKA
jgi:hypothetical protein